MMVKKKLSETEDNMEQNKAETSENKDNRDNTAEDKENQQEQTQEGNTEKNDPENEAAETKLSDKKIPDEDLFEEKLAEMQDRYLRLSAEFDNYRKRTLKEKMDISKYAGEDILKNILPFMDDFERASKHMETTTDATAMKQGIDIIYNKLSDFMKQNGVKEIESLNCSFDVDLHDAVAKIQVNEDDKKGKIVEVLSKGYFLKDKVLRHSQVVVGE
jgi:molecular chaperone GrpE